MALLGDRHCCGIHLCEPRHRYPSHLVLRHSSGRLPRGSRWPSQGDGRKQGKQRKIHHSQRHPPSFLLAGIASPQASPRYVLIITRSTKQEHRLTWWKHSHSLRIPRERRSWETSWYLKTRPWLWTLSPSILETHSGVLTTDLIGQVVLRVSNRTRWEFQAVRGRWRESSFELQLRYNLSTFGYGPRKCLGQHIADKIVKAVVYHMFSKYKVSLQPMQGLEGDFKVDKTSWVGLYDVDLKLEEREIGVSKTEWTWMVTFVM